MKLTDNDKSTEIRAGSQQQQKPASDALKRFIYLQLKYAGGKHTSKSNCGKESTSSKSK